VTCASRAHSYKRSKEIANHMAGLYLRSVASLLPSAAGSAIIAAGSAINTFQEERTALPQVYPLKKLFVGFFFATGSFSDAKHRKQKLGCALNHSEFSTSSLQGLWEERKGAERVNEAEPHYPNPKKQQAQLRRSAQSSQMVCRPALTTECRM